MAQKINPPKKHRYQTATPKTPTGFYNTHKKQIMIISCIVLAVLLIAAVVIAAISAIGATIPYNLNFKNYIKLPDYMNMKFENADIDERFNTEKETLLLSAATYETITSGTIEKMYSVTIDATGYYLVDGERDGNIFNPGILEDYTITNLGNHYTSSGSPFSKEIQNALIGFDITSENKTMATIEYPEDYSVDVAKGRTIEYEITVKKVEKPILPNYTDEFVLAKTGFSGIEEYERELRNEIVENLVWNTLIEATEIIKYPQDIVDEYCLQFYEPYNQYMVENELDFAGMLTALGISQETYFDNRDAYAYGTVREEMILYCIARAEDIKVTDNDYKTIGLELAQENGYADVFTFETNVGEEALERGVLWELVKRYLVDASTFE